jgi:hypothetical protein
LPPQGFDSRTVQPIAELPGTQRKKITLKKQEVEETIGTGRYRLEKTMDGKMENVGKRKRTKTRKK